VLVVEKAPDQVPLRDLLEHLNGKLSAEHTAWILSSLLNIACYLQYAALTHNAVSPDTFFVSPEAHSGALLGGWWYATAAGARIGALPASTALIVALDVTGSMGMVADALARQGLGTMVEEVLRRKPITDLISCAWASATRIATARRCKPPSSRPIFVSPSNWNASG